MRHYDVIVVGLGAHGSATAYQLARRGFRVLGLDQFPVPHERGSSHGQTRIIRIAYYEDPAYVPLIVRALELWQELEGRAGERLFVRTGSLDASAPHDRVFKGSWESCRVHGLPHEVLTGMELSRRYPAYHLPDEFLALFQPAGGYLFAERCIAAHVSLAAAHGAELRTDERVIDWVSSGDRVTVRTERSRFSAGRLVLAAGSWNGKLLPALAPYLEPERQVVAWFITRRPDLFRPERLPVFNIAAEEGRFYGFPSSDGISFKIGKYHHLAERADPDRVDRIVHERDLATLSEFTQRYFPDVGEVVQASSVCLFTNTPDEHFAIGPLAAEPRVILLSPCSGHGFKFASVVGELVADLVSRGETDFDLSLFRTDRFAGSPSSRGRDTPEGPGVE
jgi:sarcosine oxidase